MAKNIYKDQVQVPKVLSQVNPFAIIYIIRCFPVIKLLMWEPSSYQYIDAQVTINY